MVPPLLPSAKALSTLTLLCIGLFAIIGARCTATGELVRATVILKEGDVHKTRLATQPRTMAAFQCDPTVPAAAQVLIKPRKRVPPTAAA